MRATTPSSSTPPATSPPADTGRALPHPAGTARAAAPLPPAARDLLGAASRGLTDAALAALPGDRYARAHLAALRAAAAVLAARARPSSGRSRLQSVWVLLPGVAPELTEWSAFFASGAGKRAAAEAGLQHAVSAREADDLLRDAATFLELVVTLLGTGHQEALRYEVRLRSAG